MQFCFYVLEPRRTCHVILLAGLARLCQHRVSANNGTPRGGRNEYVQLQKEKLNLLDVGRRREVPAL